ncbi:MAG: DNA ligase D, partial [Nitrosomonadales bacterium]|nr:DNA ligase D [Nitrosomonadales bacterium]
ATQLTKLKSDKSAFAEPPKGQDARGVHWLKPQLVAEVQFAAWTDSGVVRHASFIALRSDKPPKQIVHEVPLESRQIEQLETKSPRKKDAKSKTEPAPIPANTAINRSGIKVAGVALSHPAKVLFSGKGITKQGLAEYYAKVEKWILPHLHDRPLSIVRCPNGQDDQCFFQKHAAASMHTEIERIEVPTSRKDATYMLANNLPAIISLVQMGVLELHTWGASKHHLEKPDRLIFDLDPAEGLDWEAVTDAALLTRGLLEELGLRSFVKTTGGKGLHVVAPVVPEHDWDTIKQFTKGIAVHMSAQIPDRFTANMSKQKRTNKIFIDYLRNSLGATAIAAYSTRAKPNATVSVPIFWEEVGAEVRSDSFTVDNVMERLTILDEDPWKDYAKTNQRITANTLKHFSA